MSSSHAGTADTPSRRALRARRPLGRGTMGTVWRARDRALGREVAVKEIRQDPGLTEEQRAELRERMVREGRIASRINHPSVAAIHDVLIQDDSPWIIMELVEARSLEQVIDEEGPLPPRLVAEIGVDLLGALRAAHAQGITHRDVKPGNVLITESGRVVLTDFGIAKAEGDSRLTRTGMVIGSPGYTAPERARGEYTGPESDVWSLGATLYFAVEGRPAYERSTIAETLAALLTENADPPTQAGQLRPVLNGLLNKDYRQRLGAAKAETLLRMVADTPTSEMPVLTAEALMAQEAPLPDPFAGQRPPPGEGVRPSAAHHKAPPDSLPQATAQFPKGTPEWAGRRRRAPWGPAAPRARDRNGPAARSVRAPRQGRVPGRGRRGPARRPCRSRPRHPPIPRRDSITSPRTPRPPARRAPARTPARTPVRPAPLPRAATTPSGRSASRVPRGRSPRRPARARAGRPRTRAPSPPPASPRRRAAPPASRSTRCPRPRPVSPSRTTSRRASSPTSPRTTHSISHRISRRISHSQGRSSRCRRRAPATAGAVPPGAGAGHRPVRDRRATGEAPRGQPQRHAGAHGGGRRGGRGDRRAHRGPVLELTRFSS
ncbi:protein kinase [Nonomuraea antimicrobica]